MLTRRLRSAVRRRRFERDLRRLHDTLARSAMAGRYWLRGGLLLGWARERRVLPGDELDADFGFLLDDTDRLLATVDALRAAGFLPTWRFLDNTGRTTEVVFARGSARFEFIGNEVRGDRMEYLLYATDPPCQLRCEIPAHGLEEIRFLGRRWLKPDAHEAYLAAVYGDWRTPEPAYHYTAACSIVERVPWTGSSEWTDRKERGSAP